MEVLPKLPAGTGLEHTGKWQKTQNQKATEGPGLGSSGSMTLESGVPDRETLPFGSS